MNLVLIIAGLIVFYLLKRTFKIAKKYSSKRNPNFFYRDVGWGEVGIPVFNYHSIAKRSVPDSVTVDEFDCQMEYLAHNNYHTLEADEFINHIVYGKPIPQKSVLITFDDGRASLWTDAFPILNKYDIKVVCFLVPTSMLETGIRSLVNSKSSNGTDSSEVDLSNIPMITWDEARTMHASGLVDFQSHTLEHTLVHYSPEIVDFIHPEYRFGFNNFKVPLLRYGGVDRVHSRPGLGTPIYRHQPRMSAARRYFDDEELRNACTVWVENHGGEKFFTYPGWRSEMLSFIKEYRNSHHFLDVFESQEEHSLALRYSLDQSKQLIETHLPGHIVRHLAYPWNHFSVLASTFAKELGYISAFIDINPKKFPPKNNNPYLNDRYIPINEFGNDPYMITRVDARDNLVLSLWGENRLTYWRRVSSDFFEAPVWLKR